MVDSFLINQKHLLATVAMWGSVQGQGKGGQGVAVPGYALWKVLKQRVVLSARCLNRAVNVKALGCGSRCGVCGSFKVKCIPSLFIRQNSGRCIGT